MDFSAPSKLRLIVRKTRNWLKILPQKFRWMYFRWKSTILFSDVTEYSATVYGAVEYLPDLPITGVSNEQLIQNYIKHEKPNNFLEIGIGPWPVFERLTLFVENKINYVACDFQSVCDLHKKQTLARDISVKNFKYSGNTVGTYAWTLLEMVNAGEQYDVIYLDGHHTFYVDLPVIMLCDLLLRPGGVLMIDDIKWTLPFVENNMCNSFGEWSFYNKIYNSKEYTCQQKQMPHMKLLAECICVAKYGYERIPEYSQNSWWALRKGKSNFV